MPSNTFNRLLDVSDWEPWHEKADAYVTPSPTYIISQNAAGTKVCYFGDNPWVFHEYSSSLKSSNMLYFHLPKNLKLSQAQKSLTQQQSILLSLDRFTKNTCNAPLTAQTLNKYARSLGEVSAYCALNELTIFEALSSEHHCGLMHKQMPSQGKTDGFRRLVDKLVGIPSKFLGYVQAQITVRRTRSKIGDTPATTYTQTEVIPTGVYLSLLVGFKQKLTDFDIHKEQIRTLVEKVSASNMHGRNNEKNQGQNFVQATETEGIQEYCNKYGMKDVRDLARHLTLIQYCAAMTIYAFTGMRRSEAYSLNVNSLKRTTANGIVTKRELQGFTTKLDGGRKIVHWITSEDIELPFSIALFIMETIEIANGLDYNNERWLFISTAYLPFSSGNISTEKLANKEIVTGNLEPRHFQHLLPAAIITAEDILELERVDPHRVWRSEPDFAPGKHWPLAIHQVRRSTAIYAIRSGLVSLPALKSMLKHITTQMSVYYSRGASFAADFLSTEPNEPRQFIHEYRAGEDLVRAVQYTEELLLSDEPLKGPHGTWLELHSKPGLASVRYADLLANTLRRVERGELVYRHTAPGGCTFNGVCEKRMMANLIACDGCKDSTVIPKKVVRLIAVQTVLVNNCTPGTPEFQAEKEALDDLYAFSHKHGIASEAVGDSPA